MTYLSHKLIKSILLFLFIVGSLTACGGGGGSDKDKDKKADSQNWDTMKWDEGKWK